MKKTTRMMMMNVRKDGDRHWDREYRDEHEMESKFRDRRGREHYDDGRYAPMRSEYMPAYSRHDEYWYDGRSYPSPVYERKDRSKRSDRPMNKIGFALEGEMERKDEMGHDYRSDAAYHDMGDEMSHRKGDRMSGYAFGEDDMRLTKEMAHEWTSNMENEDGTTGPHWSFDQAKQVMAQKEIDGSPLDFWVALNMMYSDYCKVAKKLGIGGNMDFYVCMAKAFLDDKDAIGGGGSEKLARYYEYVVA